MKKMIFYMFVIFCLFSSITYAQENYLNITMDLSTNEVSVDSNYQITTPFNVDDFIKNVGGEYLFIFSYNSEMNFDDFKLKIILPEKAIVSERQGTLLLSRPVQISTDGRRIYLEWSKTLSINEQFTTFAQYRENVPETNYYMIIAVILVSIAFFSGYILKKFKKEKFVKSVLSEDEKNVVKIIKKTNESTQDDIKKQLNWSKTKTSKIIRNLEMKNIVIKIPYKKTNKIKLK